MAGRNVTQQLQQQNQQLQEQLQQQQGEIQGLTASVNQMAQVVQATQAAVQQLLANQERAQAPVQGNEVPVDPTQGQQVLGENPVQAQIPVQVQVQTGQYTLDRFIKNGAKAFKGTTEPQQAEAWTLNMLKTFRAMEVPENHWVRLSSCMLEDEAAFWWEAAQRADFVGRALETITWVEFIEAFNVTYYPEQVREQKSREFSNLIQGEMSVREYEQKYIQLERFAPGLCTTEKARANKFVWGLRFALKDRVANQRPRTLAEAVTISAVSEEVLDEEYGPYGKNKRKQHGNNTNNSKPAFTKANQGKQDAIGDKRKRDDQPNEENKPLCPTCKKRHGGECLKYTGKCFLCGEAGHLKRNCPKLQDKKAKE